MRSKYGSKKVEYAGKQFDSKAEAEYYKYLLELMVTGKVVNIELQPKVKLQPSFVLNDGKTFRAITYTPDFYVEYDDEEKVFIDVKGFSTQQGELKYKIYKYQHERTGMPKLIWVAKSKKYSSSGWIDYFELKKRRAENKRKGKGKR